MIAIFSQIKANNKPQPSIDYLSLSWLIAVMSARRLGLKTILHADLESAYWLENQLELPFDRVHDDLDTKLPTKKLWSLGKIATWAEQTQDFIHLDSDFFLWQLPNTPHLTIQEPEFPPEYTQYRLILEKSITCPALWDWYATKPTQKAFTTSILKAQPAQIKKYCNIALETASINADKIEKMKWQEQNWLTIILEQWLLSAHCELEKIPTSYMNAQKGSFLHLWGGKRELKYYQWMQDLARQRFPVQFKRWQKLYQ